jgi:hypothetical protein
MDNVKREKCCYRLREYCTRFPFDATDIASLPTCKAAFEIKQMCNKGKEFCEAKCTT